MDKLLYRNVVCIDIYQAWILEGAMRAIAPHPKIKNKTLKVLMNTEIIIKLILPSNRFDVSASALYTSQTPHQIRRRDKPSRLSGIYANPFLLFSIYSSFNYIYLRVNFSHNNCSYVTQLFVKLAVLFYNLHHNNGIQLVKNDVRLISNNWWCIIEVSSAKPFSRKTVYCLLVYKF